MFESPLATAELSRLVALLSRLDEHVDDAERVDQIRLLEELKAAAAAAQAQVTTAFTDSQRASRSAGGAGAGSGAGAGVVGKDVGQGVAAQVALARRESPARATRYLGWAGVLVRELPATFRLLQAGRISEWRAQIVARETGWLSFEDRAQVDAALAHRLEQLSDRQVEAEARKLAYRLDPHGLLARIRSAESDRRVTLRPAPDTMSLLSGLLPVTQGAAVHASLARQADSLRASGDARSRGQIMADTLVERVTGQAAADAVTVEVNLVMTDQTLFNLASGQRPDSGGTGLEAGVPSAGADEPAMVQGYGPVPAEFARRLLNPTEVADGAPTGAGDAGKVTAWLRRLYAHPTSGQLVAMESTRRAFPGGLRRMLILRDQTCRTPWCSAPIRHIDHVLPAERGGGTTAANGQALCEACNHAKQAFGWRTRPAPEPAGAGACVKITTPTGHRYRSRPPDLPSHSPPRSRPRQAPSVGEDHLRRLLTAS